MNNAKHKYRSFGLNIVSDFILPSLMPVGDDVQGDIHISLGTVPSEIDGIIEKDENYQISKNQLLFKIEGIGSYFASNGARITVQPDKYADDCLAREHLLGTSMGAILLQRGMLPLHGSAVVINGCCIVFTGASGAGKSTLTSIFRKMGYLFLSDDITVITFNKEGMPYVEPAFPQQKLCMDSMEMTGDDTSSLLKADNAKDKYTVPVLSGYMLSPVRLAAVCEIIPEICGNPELYRIYGTQKLPLLIRNIYRVELLKRFGINAQYFKQFVDVAANTDFFRLIRPKGIFSLMEQVELIKSGISLFSEKAV